VAIESQCISLLLINSNLGFISHR